MKKQIQASVMAVVEKHAAQIKSTDANRVLKGETFVAYLNRMKAQRAVLAK